MANALPGGDTNERERHRDAPKHFGQERAEEIHADCAKLSPDFAAMVTDFLAAEVWCQPNLEMKTQRLITMVALTALARVNGLRLNIELALNN